MNGGGVARLGRDRGENVLYKKKKKKLFHFIFIGNCVFERVVKFHTCVKNRVSFYVLTDWAYFRGFFVFGFILLRVSTFCYSHECCKAYVIWIQISPFVVGDYEDSDKTHNKVQPKYKGSFESMRSWSFLVTLQ